MTLLLSGSLVGIAVANFDYEESDRTTGNVTLFGSGL
jgi:hypothetical protein